MEYIGAIIKAIKNLFLIYVFWILVVFLYSLYLSMI